LLIEVLDQARVNIREGVDPALLEKERVLQRLLNSKAESQTRLLSQKHTEEDASAMNKELEAIILDYQRVRAEIRANGTRYALLTQPSRLDLKTIQQDVLDPDTLLLEYSLGERRSFLWAVTPESIAQFNLPPREQIETVARNLYRLTVARDVHPK